jgi:hypothetical protein
MDTWVQGGRNMVMLNDTLSLNKLPQEIRDDYRGDRTISRSALIAIARKKQARSMITAYNAYKAQQQKGKTKGETDLKSVPRGNEHHAA